jgi:hypothetical protein
MNPEQQRIALSMLELAQKKIDANFSNDDLAKLIASEGSTLEQRKKNIQNTLMDIIDKI